jgi:hypothetical protein
MKEKGLLHGYKRVDANRTLTTQEAIGMRLTVAGLRGLVKQDLPIEFTEDRLTSYSGLELVRRYVEQLQLARRVRQALQPYALGGDYGSGRLSLLVLTLLIVGGRRLEHLKYIGSDALVGRLCGLARIPSARTVVNWLKQFTSPCVQALRALNRDLICEQIERLGLRRLTIDVDGTVIQTGSTVAWAQRGFNPHHRKNPSYYPLLAHLAQTGQILRLRNRPGNVHDSKGAVDFLRTLITELRERFGRSRVLEFRMDAAFFQREILRRLQRFDCEDAIKVPFCPWVGLKTKVAAQRQWSRVDDSISYFDTDLVLAPWNLTVRVVVYRKRVAHQTRKNFQLDLFSPDDGHFEYSAVATNKTLSGPMLWAFAAGRGAQEKTLAELKGEFALDVVPTRHYTANSVWQQLCILAHTVMCGFQLLTLAESRPRSAKRTYTYVLRSMRTLRFLLIARAGRLCRPDGRQVLRLSANPATRSLYEDVSHALAA